MQNRVQSYNFFCIHANYSDLFAEKRLFAVFCENCARTLAYVIFFVYFCAAKNIQPYDFRQIRECRLVL